MILSASRRTDIPAFYPAWFMNRLREGYVLVPGIYAPNRLSRIILSPDTCDCIVFWSKNPAPLMPYLSEIDEFGYQYYFEFTLNAYESDIEKQVPPFSKRVDTFLRLSDAVSPQKVDWRYDPVLINSTYSVNWHIEQFAKLCEKLSGKTERCILSFFDSYAHLNGAFREPDIWEVHEIASRFSQIAEEVHLPLFTCAEKYDLSQYGIRHSACIDKAKIERIIGCPICAKKDANQREECCCIESVDIGSYNSCLHSCAYCYANTSNEKAAARAGRHIKTSLLLIGEPTGRETITERAVKSIKITQPKLF